MYESFHFIKTRWVACAVLFFFSEGYRVAHSNLSIV